MVDSLNRITRQSYGQIDLIQLHDDLKEVEISEAYEVLKHSFLARPAHQIILDIKNLQVLSQGTIELLRKLVLFFQSLDLPIVLIGAERLNPADLIEVSQGFPVMDNLEEARVYFGSEKDSKILKTEEGSKPADQDTQKDMTDSFELDEDEVHPNQPTENLGTTPEENLKLPESFQKTASEIKADEKHEQNNTQDMEFDDQIAVLDIGNKGSEVELDDPDGVVKELSDHSEEDDIEKGQNHGGILLVILTVLAALVMVINLPVIEEEDFWKTVWEETPLQWINEILKNEEEEIPEMPAEIASALESGNSEELRRLFKAEKDLESRDEQGHTPLMKAVIYRNPGLLQYLLVLGANPDATDSQGDTALVWSASQNQTELVALLLQNGADPDRGMFNSLMWASFHGNSQMVQLLLSQGSDPNLRSRDGWTALMWASDRGHEPVIQRLLDAGANVNSQNSEGYTPLMLAVKRGRTETVKKLIEAGADSGIQGFDRKNALDIAREHKRSDLLPLLRP